MLDPTAQLETSNCRDRTLRHRKTVDGTQLAVGERMHLCSEPIKLPLGPKPGGDDVDWEVTLWALRGGAEFESRIR